MNKFIIHCKDCPISCTTETAEMTVNLGCLPAYSDVKKWFDDTGKLWACHASPENICGGFLNQLIENKEKIDFSKSLITEQTTFKEIYGK